MYLHSTYIYIDICTCKHICINEPIYISVCVLSAQKLVFLFLHKCGLTDWCDCYELFNDLIQLRSICQYTEYFLFGKVDTSSSTNINLWDLLRQSPTDALGLAECSTCLTRARATIQKETINATYIPKLRR